MSTYFDLWCRTCDAKVLSIHGNWVLEPIRDLIDSVPALVACAKLCPTVLVSGESWGLFGEDADATSFAVGRLLPHEGHDLRARDEYGRWDGLCGEWVTCGECKTKHRCALDEGHAGACSPARPGGSS